MRQCPAAHGRDGLLEHTARVAYCIQSGTTRAVEVQVAAGARDHVLLERGNALRRLSSSINEQQSVGPARSRQQHFVRHCSMS